MFSGRVGHGLLLRLERSQVHWEGNALKSVGGGLVLTELLVPLSLTRLTELVQTWFPVHTVVVFLRL